MKVVRDCVEKKLPWWVGEKVECFACGRIIQLELGDQKLSWCTLIDNNEVWIHCQKCGTKIKLKG
jgi:hypothetical protein